MRDLFKKVMTGSVLGAALLVAACGGGETAVENNTAGNITDEGLMNTGDMTGVDAVNATDANLGTLDTNVSTDLNATGTETTTGNTGTGALDATGNTGTGTGTGNTTGM